MRNHFRCTPSRIICALPSILCPDSLSPYASWHRAFFECCDFACLCHFVCVVDFYPGAVTVKRHKFNDCPSSFTYWPPRITQLKLDNNAGRYLIVLLSSLSAIPATTTSHHQTGGRASSVETHVRWIRAGFCCLHACVCDSIMEHKVE